MYKTMQRTIEQAALKAAKEMGKDLKKMSCFMSNWPEQDRLRAETALN